MKITILDPLECKLSKDLIPLVEKAVSFDSSYWRDGPYNKVKEEFQKCMIDRRSGLIGTGLLPRIENWAIKNKISIDVEIECEHQYPFSIEAPKLDGVVFRDYQKEAILECRDKRRGIVKHATGAGKTIIGMGLISMYYPTFRTIWLCHTKDLLLQTVEKFKQYGFKNIGVIGADNKIPVDKLKDYDIIASTIQSFSKLNKDKIDIFDLVVIDEAHHVVSFKSQYGKVLQSLFAWIRIGFTATVPDKTEKLLTMESLLGPVISELKVEDAVDKKILTKPVVKLIPVPYTKNVGNLRTYKDIYKWGVVKNRIRNRLLIKEVKDNIKNGKSTLIMVQHIEHGESLEKIAKILKVPIVFVHGNTDAKERLRIKNALGNKEEMAVICTSIWKEGIDIPSIDSFIFALSGKSQITVLQGAGRALRLSKGKREVIIIDFVDEAPYLAQHFARRLKIYLDNGWKIIS